jgi:myosin-5
MAHNYDVGTRAWQPDPTEGWVASEVISKTQDGDKYNLVFELANGEVCVPPVWRLCLPSGNAYDSLLMGLLE